MIVLATNLQYWLFVAAPRADRLRAIETGLRRSPDMSAVLTILIGFLAVIAILVIVRRFLDRERTTRADTPPNYFALAMERLQLKPPERHLLTDVARRAELPEPTAMLLSPANMAAALARVEQEADNPTLRSELTGLCQRLFGTTLPGVEVSQTGVPSSGSLDKRDIA